MTIDMPPRSVNLYGSSVRRGSFTAAPKGALTSRTRSMATLAKVSLENLRHTADSHGNSVSSLDNRDMLSVRYTGSSTFHVSLNNLTETPMHGVARSKLDALVSFDIARNERNTNVSDRVMAATLQALDKLPSRIIERFGAHAVSLATDVAVNESVCIEVRDALVALSNAAAETVSKRGGI